MKKIIYLVRHAEPVIHNGHKHMLTKKGKTQAAKVARALVSELDRQSSVSIHHSPVIRCQETAYIIGKELGIPIREAPLRLKNSNNLIVKDAQSKLSQYLSNYKRLAIEPPEAFAKRILNYARRQPATTLVFVGNEVPLRLLLQYIAKTDYTITIKHGGCLKVIIDDKSSRVSEIR